MKTLKVRLAKNDNEEFEFRYNGSQIVKTSHELVSMLERGINNREISNGRKIVDKSCSKYIFDFHDNKDFKYAQEPIRVQIRISNEYFEEAQEILKMLDGLCTTTSYIKTKNIARILAISLATVTFLSFAGKKIADRIKDPLGNMKDNETSYQDNAYENQMDEYYQGLKEKAESGDTEAKRKYEKYLMYKQLNAIYDDAASNEFKTK